MTPCDKAAPAEVEVTFRKVLRFMYGMRAGTENLRSRKVRSMAFAGNKSILESQLQSKLSNARIQRGPEFTEVHTVEDVEEFRAELQANSLGELEVLSESHIPIVVAGVAETALTNVSKRACRVDDESGRVEPITACDSACCGTRSSPIRITDKVRPVLAQSGVRAATVAVSTRERSERPAGLGGNQSTELPAA